MMSANGAVEIAPPEVRSPRTTPIARGHREAGHRDIPSHAGDCAEHFFDALEAEESDERAGTGRAEEAGDAAVDGRESGDFPSASVGCQDTSSPKRHSE